MLGFVQTRLHVALASGQCDDGSMVTDQKSHPVGTVMLARRQAGAAAGDDGAPPVEYEVIKLAAGVTATDLLPTGRHLLDGPTVEARQGLPVCQFRVAGGQRCGSVGPVSNGRFTIADLAVDNRDFGGPVYALTDDGDAVIVGLYEGMWNSTPELETWQAVMRQLYIDSHGEQRPQSPSDVRSAARTA